MRPMRLNKLLPILLLASSAASALSQSCPVKIEYFGQQFLNTEVLGNFQARFKNVSDKPVLGVVFKLEVMDADGSFHLASSAPQWSGKIAPGKGKHIVGNITEYYQKEPPVPGGRLTVETVSFVDGSKWKGDGCSMARDNRH